MRATTFFGLLLLTLTACPADDGGGNETGGSTGPGSTGMSSTTSMSSTSSMSTSTTDMSTSSSESGSTTDLPTTTTTGDTDTDTSGSTGPGVFTLTSPQFEQDGIIPSAHHVQGDNTMPELNWVGAPAETMSFAVFFRDLTINYRHSAIWNISADATGTPFDPEHVPMPPDPAGSVQCENWRDIGEYGYGGPGSASNTYEFEVYALDIADLSGEIDQDSSLAEVEAAFEAHVIESATLSGQTEGP